ncbi:MAG: hypothetical protein MZV64_52975 [Ignavibacteriales bacterium]|nr:hypothetical protein [Ignavibacteriales bacterium]
MPRSSRRWSWSACLRPLSRPNILARDSLSGGTPSASSSPWSSPLSWELSWR